MKVNNNNSTFVWRDMDQESLDAAYEQSNYASNMQEVIDRYQSNSEKARHEIGEPKLFQYGQKDIEKLDVYTTSKSRLRLSRSPVHKSRDTLDSNRL